MRLKCQRNQLSDVLQEMISVVPSSSMIPVLNHIVIKVDHNSIEITGSDLEISLISSFNCESEEVFQAVVPAKLFADIVKMMSEEEITIEVEGQNFHILGSSNRFLLNCMESAEFPALPMVEGDTYTIQGQELLNQYRKVNSAISAKGEGNTAFTCVLLQTFANELRMVSTDGQRLIIAKHWETGDLNSLDLMLAPKVFQILSKIAGKSLENIQLIVGEREIAIKLENKMLISRIKDGNFPDYERVIPSSVTYRFELCTLELMQSLQRLNVLVRNTTKRITLKTLENQIILSASDPEMGSGEESLPATLSGGDFEAVFDVRKMIEGVEGIESKEIVLETAGPLHPLIMKEKDSDKYLYLLVSLRKP